MKQEQSNKLLLIDGHSILNRAFFGLPDLTNAAGQHTNAVYGFLNIMFKIMDTEKPSYLTVAFDEHAPTFRHKMFAEYKGTRKPMADELRQQVPMMKQMLTAMGITVISKEGLEADDLLGTMARLAEDQGMEVTIVSGDRDLLQLATDHTKISIPKTKKTGTEIENYYAADVAERYLVTPTEFIDVKALMGDTADNIQPSFPSIIRSRQHMRQQISYARRVPPRISWSFTIRRSCQRNWRPLRCTRTSPMICKRQDLRISLPRRHMRCARNGSSRIF